MTSVCGSRCFGILTLLNALITYTTALKLTNLIIPPPSFTTTSNATITWAHDGNDPAVMDIKLLHKNGQIDILASSFPVSNGSYLAIMPFTTLQIGGWGKVQCIRQDDNSILDATPRLRVQDGNVIVPFSQAVPVTIQSSPTPTSTNTPTGGSPTTDSDGDANADSTSSSVIATNTASQPAKVGGTTLTLAPSPVHTATATPTPISSSSSSLSVGARAGIGIGVAGSISLIGLTAIFLLHRYRRQKNKFRSKEDFGSSTFEPHARLQTTKGTGVFKAEMAPDQAESKQTPQSEPVPATISSLISRFIPIHTKNRNDDNPTTPATTTRRQNTLETEVSESDRGARLSPISEPTVSSVRMHGGLRSLNSDDTETESNEGPVELDVGIVDLEAQGINEPSERRSARIHGVPSRWRFSRTDGGWI
ncbi:MAG: hypothetical protein Q9160_008071 [Pyrenula sp. 1 TL-2023]